jgi:hypothetical protein
MFLLISVDVWVGKRGDVLACSLQFVSAGGRARDVLASSVAISLGQVTNIMISPPCCPRGLLRSNMRFVRG